MERRLLALVCLIAAAPATASACSGDSAADTSSAPPSSTPDAGAPDAASDARGDAPLDSLDGWERFDDYSPRCEFYTPKAPLPPSRWEPCAAGSGVPPAACRTMVVDWEAPSDGSSKLGSDNAGIRRKDGSFALMTTRVIGGDVVSTVSGPDEPVAVAIRQHGRHCILNDVPSDGDTYAFSVFDDELTGELAPEGGGVIGGRFGERPRVLAHHHDKVVYDYVAGGPGVVEIPDIYGAKLLSWQDGSVTPVPVLPEEEGWGHSYWFWSGDALFWAADVKPSYRESVFTLAGGAKNLFDSGPDPNDGIADLGTDGKVMVWAKASKRPSPPDPFETVALYSSPFTTDASKIVPHLVRGDFTGALFAVSPAIVGCGYVARQSELRRADGTKIRGLVLVRLSDGGAWAFPEDDPATWAFQVPLGLTCDELFVTGAMRTKPRTDFVARIRISELGPPIPVP